MGIFSIFGFGNRKIKDAIRRGAMVIDVRTATEFDQGRVPGSINIPGDRIPVNAERIREMNRPIIFVCSTGARSSKAASIMQEKGLKEVYNAGSWENLLKILRQ